MVEAELERLLCDEADDPENATCTIDELQSALKETHPGMAVEADALRAILTVLVDVDLIDIVRNVIDRDGGVSELCGRIRPRWARLFEFNAFIRLFGRSKKRWAGPRSPGNQFGVAPVEGSRDPPYLPTVGGRANVHAS